MTKFMNYKSLFLVMFVCWTSLIIFETFIEIREFKAHMMFTAMESAKAFTEKDISIRKWAAYHGGVYVPVTEETPPNPNLAFIHRRDIRGCDSEGNCEDLTLMNPAYIIRELYEKFSPVTTSARITSLKPLRAENGPDRWERQALEELEKGADRISETVDNNSTSFFHYMIPLVAERPCLKCHARQGYQNGDIRGGLHVKLSMNNILRDFKIHRNRIFIIQFLVWLAGLAMLSLVYKAMKTACTEKEKARDEIQGREHFLRTLINAIPDPVCFKDGKGRWLESNSKHIELFQLEGIDYHGKTSSELAAMTHPVFKDAMQCCEESDQATWENREITRFDEIITLPDGNTRIFDVIKVPLYDSSGGRTGILVVARDITSRKQLEAQLQQSQKMEAVGVLAGGVAHDLNNIIQTIMGAAGLSIMKLDPSHAACRYVRQIDDSCERAAAIIGQLLIFSRRHEFTPEPLDLNEIAGDIIKMLKRLIGEDITVETRFAPDIHTVMADRGSIEQVIMNLVVNSRDAMPDGGTITITTENYSPNEEDLTQNSDIREGDYCCISISDSGIGISDSIITKIFDPFFTTKGVGKGTGLGLSTVYGIISKQGGWVDVESEPGDGAVFRVYIPAAKPEDLDQEAARECEVKQEDELRGRGERILIVEDDEDIRRVVTEMLGSMGYSATAVATGEDALKLLEESNENFDVMLVDMVLPGMKGLDLVRMISHRNNLPGVILNSGYADERSDISSLSGEYIRFIAKPYEFRELLKLIRDILNESRDD